MIPIPDGIKRIRGRSSSLCLVRRQVGRFGAATGLERLMQAFDLDGDLNTKSRSSRRFLNRALRDEVLATEGTEGHRDDDDCLI